MTSQAKYRWNKELRESRDLLKRKKREIPFAKKKKKKSRRVKMMEGSRPSSYGLWEIWLRSAFCCWI